MRFPEPAQLGFDLDTPAAPTVPASSVAPAAVPTLYLTPPDEHARGVAEGPPSAQSVERPSRGKAATRARTAVLFSRLQGMGLRGVESLVLMRTRTVMVSLIGRTLRVHEAYADAPDDILRAIVSFAVSRTRAARTAARDAILAHEIDRAPAARRVERPRPGDLALVAQLTAAHRELNLRWFGGTLRDVPMRVSGRMASRLGHYDPGSKATPPEIALSRAHVVKHGWREAMHTLLHEMVHQWQHESGQPVDHGAAFRRKCREVGITPSATRAVTPLAKRRLREA